MYRVGVVTLSDKGYSGEREDLSGPLIVEILNKTGEYKVEKQIVLPDEFDMLAEELKVMSDELKLDLIFTTGGTGFSSRDITPEATLSVSDKVANGISNAILFNSLNITKRACLSRAVSVIRKKTLIINLPGSPKAVKEALDYIVDVLPHALSVLDDKAYECARE